MMMPVAVERDDQVASIGLLDVATSHARVE